MGKGQGQTKRSSISRDAAVAATRPILEEFFFVYPEPEMTIVGARLVAIIQAATDAALELQRRQFASVSDN
jgi:hypothetical protein